MTYDPTIERIRDGNDIVEVIEEVVRLRKAGAQYQGLCPFHADKKSPSFLVNPGKQVYHCHGCLDAEELIWTPTGLRHIGDVRPGDQVFDAKGWTQDVLAVQHKHGPTLAVSLGSFRRDPLVLTPDHTCYYVQERDALDACQFLYYSTTRQKARFKSSYKGIWRTKDVSITQGPASSLCVGDYFLFPVSTNRRSTTLSAPWVLKPYTRGPANARIEGLPVSVAAARLYGLYLAEGSTGPRHIIWTFNASEYDSLAAEVIAALKEVFGVRAVRYYTRANTCEVRCSKTDLARQLEYWFGKGAAHKRIPGQVFHWPVELQQALISAWQDGDGDATVSRELAYGIYALGIQAGCVMSLGRWDARVSPKGQNHAEYWTITSLTRERIDGFYHPITGQTYFWARVSSVAPANPRRVVDISVTGSQTFLTKLGAVHNCQASGDVFSFIQQSRGVSFADAKKILADRAGISLQEESREEREERLRVRREAEALAADCRWFIDRIRRVYLACAREIQFIDQQWSLWASRQIDMEHPNWAWGPIILDLQRLAAWYWRRLDYLDKADPHDVFAAYLKWRAEHPKTPAEIAARAADVQAERQGDVLIARLGALVETAPAEAWTALPADRYEACLVAASRSVPCQR